MIQCRILLRSVDLVAARHDQTSHPENNPFGFSSKVRQSRGGLEEISVLSVVDGFESSRGNMVLVHLRAPNHVVMHPNRIEAHLFGRFGGADDVFNARKRTRIWHSNTERDLVHD